MLLNFSKRMTWPVLNVYRIWRREAACARQAPAGPVGAAKAGDNDDEEQDGTQSWFGELFVRYLRLSTYLVVALLAYRFTWPFEAAAKGFAPRWIALVVGRNLFVEALLVGGWHWFVYERPSAFVPKVKFNPKDQYAPGTDGIANLRREQLYTTLGFLMSSAYEVVVLRLWASGSAWLQPCYEDFWAFPAWSIFHIIVVAYWRDFHFYFCHRLMHPWRFKVLGLGDPGAFLYRHVHSLHHKSHNPGPWSGLSMHPVEHFLYCSCTLLNAFFSLHPLHFLFNKFHADISPIAGHDGHDQPCGGSVFHYIHRKFACLPSPPLP